MGKRLSLLPVEVDLELQRNTDNTITFQIRDASGPLNITNDSVRCTVLDADGEQIMQTTNAAGQHIGPTEGKTAFTFSRVLTADTDAGKITRWTYQVRRIKDGSGAEVVHIAGDMEIHP